MIVVASLYDALRPRLEAATKIALRQLQNIDVDRIEALRAAVRLANTTSDVFAISEGEMSHYLDRMEALITRVH